MGRTVTVRVRSVSQLPANDGAILHVRAAPYQRRWEGSCRRRTIALKPGWASRRMFWQNNAFDARGAFKSHEVLDEYNRFVGRAPRSCARNGCAAVLHAAVAHRARRGRVSVRRRRPPLRRHVQQRAVRRPRQPACRRGDGAPAGHAERPQPLSARRHRRLRRAPDEVCTEPAIESVVFSCSGTEANEVALRMARIATGKRGIVCTNATYHGNSEAVGVLTRTRGDQPNAPRRARHSVPREISARWRRASPRTHRSRRLSRPAAAARSGISRRTAAASPG